MLPVVTKYKSRDHLTYSYMLWRYFEWMLFRQKTLLSGISDRFDLSKCFGDLQYFTLNQK